MTGTERLRLAAEGVRRGWTQHWMLASDGTRCALGWLLLDDDIVVAIRDQGYQDAREALRLECCTPTVRGIATWNDMHGQTAERVARTMERAAFRLLKHVDVPAADVPDAALVLA